MARSSKDDILEKFRFQVTILKNPSPLDPANIGNTSSIGNVVEGKLSGRIGFSQVTPPKATINVMKYRENNMGFSPIKVPGLVTHEDVVLKRGMTLSRDLYKWYILVNNDAGTINKFQAAAVAFSAVPFQNPSFRKDVIISSMDREGKYTKHWILYNAFPSSYKGASDLDSATSELIIEELSLAYELVIEVDAESIEDALNKAAIEGEKQALVAAGVGALRSAGDN